MAFEYDMDLYALTPEFLIRHKIERYSSLIWTERYSAAGDFQLVFPPTDQLVSVLHPGRFVGLRGRREVMIIDTLSFDDSTQLFTITGKSLIAFLNQRIAWFENPDYHTSGDSLTADYITENQTAGEFICDVVDKVAINPVPFASPYDSVNLDWNEDKFSSLSISRTSHVGAHKHLSFPNGTPLYDGITQLAAQEHVGISMYLAQADFGTGEYVLRFATYHGRDRTSDQTDNETIRFTPKTETLVAGKEVRANTEYKNVLYVRHKNHITVHYPEFVNSPPAGFNRRVMYAEAPDVNYTGDQLTRFLAGFAHKQFRAQRNTYTIDGQSVTSPDLYSQGHESTSYKFGVDYYLGDVVEVEGNSGFIVKARVTEYIRSQDQYGMKEYPTLEVMAEDQTHYDSDPTFNPPS